jgi:hypothetical protein
MRWLSLHTSSSIKLSRYKFCVVDATPDLTSDGKVAPPETAKIFVETSTVSLLAVVLRASWLPPLRFIPQWQVPGESFFIIAEGLLNDVITFR